MLGPYSWAGVSPLPTHHMTDEETEVQRGKALAVGHTPARNVDLGLRLWSTEPSRQTPHLRPKVSRVWTLGQRALRQGLEEVGADETCFFYMSCVILIITLFTESVYTRGITQSSPKHVKS